MATRERSVEIQGKYFHENSIECALAHARQETALILESCQDASARGKAREAINRAHPESLIGILRTSKVVPGKKAAVERIVEFVREVMDVHQPLLRGQAARDEARA